MSQIERIFVDGRLNFLWLMIGFSLNFLSLCASAQTSAETFDGEYSRMNRNREIMTRADESYSAAIKHFKGPEKFPQSCLQAAPLLLKTLAYLEEYSSPNYSSIESQKSSAELWAGMCDMALENYSDAHKWFSLAANRRQMYFSEEALSCLGDLYANGFGVSPDKTRALGYYVASAVFCRVTGKDSKREAAEIAISLNPMASSDLSHPGMQLLLHGKSKNWLRAIQLYSKHNSHDQYIMPLVYQGIESGKSYKDDLDEEERSAFQKLNLMLGDYYFNQGYLAGAYASIRAAGQSIPSSSMAKLQGRLDYRLILKNDQVWNAESTQP